jgi:hypothetical protein
MSKFIRMQFYAAAVLTVAIPSLASGQAAAPAAPAAAAAPFVMANVGLTFTPPAGWAAQDVAKLKAAADPESAKCSELLYAAAPPEARAGYQGLSVGVTLFEASRTCAPAEMPAEAQMKSIVENTAKMPGMKVYKDFAPYSIEGRSFEGMIVKGKPQGTTVAGDIYIAMIGGVVKDHGKEHVLLWELVAPDAPMMQQMINSTVEFTGKKPHELYKAKLK